MVTSSNMALNTSQKNNAPFTWKSLPVFVLWYVFVRAPQRYFGGLGLALPTIFTCIVSGLLGGYAMDHGYLPLEYSAWLVVPPMIVFGWTVYSMVKQGKKKAS